MATEMQLGWRYRSGNDASETTRQVQKLLDVADIRINGDRPWDLQIKHPDMLDRVLALGSLGLGESYMDGWWDCERLDEFFCRLLRARIDTQVQPAWSWWSILRARIFNLQTPDRAWTVARQHYDLDNGLYEAMLGPNMAYSCGYWAQARTLEQAQEAKLELICRKLELEPGMSLLDIGCGWGSLMRYAATHFGVNCVGLTVSREQARWGAAYCSGLPVSFELLDYRSYQPAGGKVFDRIASVGMFEHVGHKNYATFFQMARRLLATDGLFLLHTIGKNQSGAPIDPWIEKYVFPNGALPSVAELAQAAQGEFVIEDWHNFGADYDRTLMAWHARVEKAWPRLRSTYGERFRRMWRYYLLSCAGAFRARDNQLWQVVLSPGGVPAGYRRPAL